MLLVSFAKAASALETESGFKVEPPCGKRFRNAILVGDYESAAAEFEQLGIKPEVRSKIRVHIPAASCENRKELVLQTILALAIPADADSLRRVVDASHSQIYGVRAEVSRDD